MKPGSIVDYDAYYILPFLPLGNHPDHIWPNLSYELTSGNAEIIDFGCELSPPYQMTIGLSDLAGVEDLYLDIGVQMDYDQESIDNISTSCPESATNITSTSLYFKEVDFNKTDMTTGEPATFFDLANTIVFKLSVRVKVSEGLRGGSTVLGEATVSYGGVSFFEHESNRYFVEEYLPSICQGPEPEGIQDPGVQKSVCALYEYGGMSLTGYDLVLRSMENVWDPVTGEHYIEYS